MTENQNNKYIDIIESNYYNNCLNQFKRKAKEEFEMIKKWKINKNEFLFFTAYIIFLLYKILSTSTFDEILGNTIISCMKWISWALFIVKILLFNIKNLKLNIIHFSLIILSIIIRICSGSSEIFELFVVIIAASNIEFNKIAKVTLIETSLLCVIIIVSSLIGIIPNPSFPRANGEYRMSLGFNYVGKLSNYLLQIIFLNLYLYESKNKDISIPKLIVYCAISTVVFFVSYVRNPYMLSLALIILYALIIKYKKINFKKYNKLISLAFIVCFIVIFLLVNSFNKESLIYNQINKILNNRLSVMNRVCDDYNFNLFGNKIEMKGWGYINESYTYVDSGYISILIRDGYVAMILIAVLYTYLIKNNIEKGNNTMVIWLVLIAISSIIDDILLQVCFNCSILTLFEPINNLILKNERKEFKDDESSCGSGNI